MDTRYSRELSQPLLQQPGLIIPQIGSPQSTSPQLPTSPPPPKEEAVTSLEKRGRYEEYLNSVQYALTDLNIWLLTGMIMVYEGRLSDFNSTAAASVSLVWYNMIGYAPLASQNMGFLKMASIELATTKRNSEIMIKYQRTIMVNLILTAISTILLLKTTRFALWMGIDEEISNRAFYISVGLIPGLYAQCLFEATKSLLIAHGHFSTHLIVNAVAYGLNILLNGLFFYKLGTNYAATALARSISEICGALILIVLAKKQNGIPEEIWGTFSPQAFKGIVGHLIDNLFGASSNFLEMWFWDVTIVLTASLSSLNVATLSIVLIIVGVWRFIPMILQILTQSDMLKILLNKEFGEVRSHFRKGLYGVMFVASTIAVLDWIFIDQIMSFFTTDLNLHKALLSTRWLLIPFIITDALKCYTHASLKGIMLHKHSNQYLHFSYYMIGMTVILMCSFYRDLGIYGILIGILSGQSLFLSIAYLEMKKLDWERHVLMITNPKALQEEEAAKEGPAIPHMQINPNPMIDPTMVVIPKAQAPKGQVIPQNPTVIPQNNAQRKR